jgi:hypothetical protein
MPELLDPTEMTSTSDKDRLLTTGESFPPVVFPATPGWLILSAPQDGMPEMLLPIKQNKLTDGDPVSEDTFIHLLSLLFYSHVPLSFHEK